VNHALATGGDELQRETSMTKKQGEGADKSLEEMADAVNETRRTAMAEVRSVPGAEEVERLRQAWVGFGEAAFRAGEDMASLGGGLPGSEAAAKAAARFHTACALQGAKWNEYQDAVTRRADAQQAAEIKATNALAAANTTLAARQFWLAIVIAAATIVQAVAAVHGPWSGGAR
jgi:hypothetical protein